MTVKVAVGHGALIILRKRRHVAEQNELQNGLFYGRHIFQFVKEFALFA